MLGLAAAFFGRIKAQAATAGLLSDEHFTVDGTLIEAWAPLAKTEVFVNKQPHLRQGGGVVARKLNTAASYFPLVAQASSL